MRSSYIDITNEDIVFGLMNNDKKLKSFISDFPSYDNIINHSEKKKLEFSKEKRKILVAEIKQQYKGIKISKTLNNIINSLLDEKTFSVTSGHQLSLFSGPIYFIYKIISTIKIVSELNNRSKKQKFVPIFWLASEDHDFDEISQVNISGKSLKWEKETLNQPVGKINSDEIENVIKKYKNEIIDSKYSNKLIKLIDDHYTSFTSLSKATRSFINSLFSEYGIIVIDADSKNFKETFVNNMKNEVLSGLCKMTVSKQIQDIKKSFKDYKPQVNPSDINFFKIGDSGRVRIRKQGSGFKIDKDSKNITKDHLINEITDYPEKFSPNVIMRPLYQEMILPNVCFIGGSSEIKYWIQLKSYFDKSKVVFPILTIRNSAFFVNSKISKNIEKSELKMQNFFVSKEKLLKDKVSQLSKTNLNFDDLRKTLSNQFEYFKKISRETDKSFIGAISAQEKKQLNGIDNLEKKFYKSQKIKHQQELERIEQIYNFLYPDNIPQERVINFGNIYAELGDNLFKILLKNFKPFENKILVLELED